MKKIGVAIIGPGIGYNGFGLGGYIMQQVLQDARAELIAVGGTTHESLQKDLLAAGSIARIYTEEIIERIFELDEIDLVIICSPDHTHLRYLGLAVKNGKHALVEKPLVELTQGHNADTAVALKLLFDQAERQHTLISTNCQRAFIPEFLGVYDVKNNIKIEIGIGKKHIEISRERLVKLLISHPVSILVKLGLTDVKCYSSIKAYTATEQKNRIQLDFSYDNRIAGTIVLHQYDIERPAEIKLAVDGNSEVCVAAEKMADTFRTKYESDTDTLYSSDLLAHTIARMIESVYDKKVMPLITNKDSYHIYEIETLLAQECLEQLNDQKLPPLSVFMPLYNCAGYIDSHIHSTYDYLESHFADFELTVVDDSSTDQTLAVVTGLLAVYPKLKVIKNPNGPSKRENLAKAMMSARFDHVFFQDQDLPVPLHYIAPLARRVIYEDHDIAIGSRYAGPAPERSLYRLLLSRSFNLVINSFFHTPFSDHICGFKAYKKKKLLLLLGEMGYDHSGSRGWFWDAELLIRAQKNNMAVYEMPVQWSDHHGSTFRLRTEFAMIGYIVRFYKKISQRNTSKVNEPG